MRELRNISERLICRVPGGVIQPNDLPTEVLSAAAVSDVALSKPAAAPPSQGLLDRILLRGESFWDVAYEPFMARDLTREDIRHLVRVGLEQTRGNYKALVQLFNMEPQDYKRFLNFLRKYRLPHAVPAVPHGAAASRPEWRRGHGRRTRATARPGATPTYGG